MVYVGDYEFKFGDNGMILNGNDSMPVVGAPVFDIDEVTGLDLPDVKSTSKDHDGWDGGAVEAAFLSTRTMVMKGTLICHQNDSLEFWLDKLKMNYAPTNYAENNLNARFFYVKAPGASERRIICKSLGLKYVWNRDRRFNSTAFQVTLQAAEPFFQSLQGKSIGPSPAGNPTQYWNEGTAPVYPLIILKALGAVTSPIRVLHQGLNLGIQLDSANLALNEEVYLDLKGRSVNKVVGFAGTNWRNKVTEEGWFALKPKGNSILTTVNSGSLTTTILGTDAWF